MTAYDKSAYAAPIYGQDSPVQNLGFRACVGIVLFNHQGQVFNGHRCKGDLPLDAPLWQYPQGGIDEGETPYMAALRELKEETGVAPAHIEVLYELPFWLAYDLPAALIGTALKGQYRGQKQKWFAMRLTAPDSAIKLDADKKPEFDDWQWRSLKECADLVIPFKHHIYQTLAEQFAYLEH